MFLNIRHCCCAWPILVAGLSIPLSLAGATPASKAKIDRSHIQDLYHAGELKAIESKLVGLLKQRPVLSKSDSIFVYKYVGVALAADSLSKPLAKDYLYKLLALAPDVDIIDMYVSDGIYALFTDVRKEFLTRSKYVQSKTAIESGKSNAIDDTLSQPVKPRTANASTRAQPADRSNKRWLFWTLGGAAVAGGAIALYLLTQTAASAPRDTISNAP